MDSQLTSAQQFEIERINANEDIKPEQKAVLIRATKGLMPLPDQEIFDKLVTMNPESLTDYDRAFLRARRGYLNHEQERIFDSVLNEQILSEEDEEKLIQDQPSKALVKVAEDLGIETDGLTTDELKEEIKKAEKA